MTRNLMDEVATRCSLTVKTWSLGDGRTFYNIFPLEGEQEKDPLYSAIEEKDVWSFLAGVKVGRELGGDDD